MSLWPAMTWAMCGGRPLDDGIGDEDSAEVVRRVVQRLAAGVFQAGVGEGGVEHVPERGVADGPDPPVNRRWNKTGDGGRHLAFVAVVDRNERDRPAELPDPGDDDR